MQHSLHQIKAQQFYTDLDLYQQCSVLQKIEEFKDFSRPFSDFPVHFKADLIFKDFSRKSSKFKYFSNPANTPTNLFSIKPVQLHLFTIFSPKTKNLSFRTVSHINLY